MDLAEATMLVGIPKSPSNYSPLVNIKLAKKRQKLILSLMVQNKVITDSEMEEAINEKLTYYGKKETNNLTTVMYYQDAVLNELKTIKNIPSSYTQTKGLKIYTNLDMKAQSSLEKNINEQIPENSEIQVSSVMINPKMVE